MEVTRCAATWCPRIWGEAGTFLASDGADASTGQAIYVDCACQITGV
jgi:enoyl-[acyl-carrier-protein] reductase (NADH)